MSVPLLQYFCCPNNAFGLRGGNASEELTELTTGRNFLSFNITCAAASAVGIVGAGCQLRTRIPRCFGFVQTPEIALLLLVQNNIVGCLAVADLLAAAGILVRSSAWLAGVLPHATNISDSYNIETVLCVVLSAWIQFFLLCTYLWTLMLAINMNYMSRSPAPQHSWMWLYHILTWPLAAVICAVGLLPLYWSSLSSCVQQQPFVIPVYVSTYVPLVLVMIATAGLYANSVGHVIETNISGFREMNDRDRCIAWRVRDKFFSFVLVFYVCWIPNIVSVSLLLLPSFPAEASVAVWLLMACLNPLQGLLNCLAYRRVSVRWPSIPADRPPPSPRLDSATDNSNWTVEDDVSSLLIFGDT